MRKYREMIEKNKYRKTIHFSNKASQNGFNNIFFFFSHLCVVLILRVCSRFPYLVFSIPISKVRGIVLPRFLSISGLEWTKQKSGSYSILFYINYKFISPHLYIFLNIAIVTTFNFFSLFRFFKISISFIKRNYS